VEIRYPEYFRVKCYNGNSVRLWIISVCIKKYQHLLVHEDVLIMAKQAAAWEAGVEEVVVALIGGVAIVLRCSQGEGVRGGVAWEPYLQEGPSLPRGVEAMEMVVLHGFSLLFLGEQREEEDGGDEFATLRWVR
jgi:hypothetical protein